MLGWALTQAGVKIVDPKKKDLVAEDPLAFPAADAGKSAPPTPKVAPKDAQAKVAPPAVEEEEEEETASVEEAAAEETKEPAVAAEGQEEEKVDEEAKSSLEDQVKAKREAIDKQQAFIEFKQSEQGASFEGNIRERRGVLRDKRAEIREVTD